MQKAYNSADGTPDRSEKRMLQEHPLTSKILRVHTALFSVAGACIMVLVWPQKPLGQTAFCRVVNAVGTIAIFVLIAVGFILIAMAFAARKKA